ncbi:hypothetical protein KGF86_01920 [Ornithinibacillus massiliensis]|uniref:Uncharacterized protein n=1 Tax=Ornithinibacillus massiliensis TaxID=1944633 RepID=A0ABS5M9I4_9BACI|nr:three component ABC system middle component [Ornithinibacillus massiliensis]MBS3678960.1 hypothetical protein [Ornithinibacillus massiliensis]
MLQNQPVEVRNLLNSAFCGEVIRRCIKSYEKNTGALFPYSIVYFILPLVLHEETRISISNNSRKHLHVWLDTEVQLKIKSANRIKSMVPITNEALIFLLSNGYISVNKNKILVKNYRRKNKQFENTEVQECFNAAEILGRWFGKAGKETTIFSMFGVKP